MQNIKEVVGARVRELRKEKGMSQEELAHAANLHPTYIGKLERGERNMSVESLDKATQALGITLEQLFRYIQPSNQDEESMVMEQIINRLYGKSLQEKHTILKLIDTAFELQDK
ncbi:helix-turn-helix domain-containing protein [Paenibacillus sp. NPDC058367]|jgi:transcriptional regulator with XRE-family HTH domain|uniref:helix-turn-helix domain-containing protein n=1 Tax=Paenibacillus sp. NPDC058367 TaxID=3346460 RepID=UPI0036552A9F